MPNDDLGTFPMPNQAPVLTPDPLVPDPVTPPQVDPATPPTQDTAPTPEPEAITFTSPFDTPENDTQEPVQPEPEPITETAIPPLNTPAPIPEAPLPPMEEETPLNQVPPVTDSLPPFEETPDEIPSVISTPSTTTLDTLVAANEDLIEKHTEEIKAPEPVTPQYEPVVENAPAIAPQKRSLTPIIIAGLVVVAFIGLAAAAFLSSQTGKLKTQLEEITQTLEKQQTTLTPTATPTVFEIPTPTITPVSTQSAVIATPSATPTISQVLNTLQPLKNAPSILKIAINRSPNAQLILVKIDNASDANTSVTKYFFREDLTTKKYFYVAITGKGEPQIIDKQIYVTPDDNIPSLNDAILGNKLGLDLEEALKIAYSQCANQTLCTTSPVKAQYIKTGTGIIWQLSLYTKGLSATPLMIQINAETKAVLYKSPEFANK